MKGRNRYGEPWTRDQEKLGDLRISAVGVCGEKLDLLDEYGFIWETHWRRLILCVNACAGLTRAEIRRGLVPKAGKGGA